MTWSGPISDGPPPRERSDAPRTRTRIIQVGKAGIGFGSTLAMVISWSVHQSVLLAILHGFLGWLYVLWHVVTR